MKIDKVLIGPVLTEKATKLAATSVYMFKVDKQANKFQIKDALEKLFPVKVAEVRIINRKGKTKRKGRRMMQKQLPSKKIALIKVKSGKIDIFPQT